MSTTQTTTKPGKHGTLYLFAITWDIPGDAAFGQDVARVWAYSKEHAEEKFTDDMGWQGFEEARIVSIARAK